MYHRQWSLQKLKVQRINRSGVLSHKWNIYITSLPLKFRPHKGRRDGKILRVRDSFWNCSIFWIQQDICTHELLTAVAVSILSWGDKIITPNPRWGVYWQMMTARRGRVNFFKGVVTARLTTLQWITLHTWIYTKTAHIAHSGVFKKVHEVEKGVEDGEWNQEQQERGVESQYNQIYYMCIWNSQRRTALK